ncbi:hypothetical protein [Nitrospirillum amazonense]|uniref:hypothetical protein n=1 Tax=Nitrospirillum amazonense TaxID=28077 RepID=UPI0024127152|nr:hypothetical protein [Nitrospirillum amazonense]MDG3444652.1 hypothetical protein [Nitrospirillum amazonense]
MSRALPTLETCKAAIEWALQKRQDELASKREYIDQEQLDADPLWSALAHMGRTLDVPARPFHEELIDAICVAISLYEVLTGHYLAALYPAAALAVIHIYKWRYPKA